MYKNQQTMHSIKNCISNKEIGTKTPATPHAPVFSENLKNIFLKL
jgi:hypothetical protein